MDKLINAGKEFLEERQDNDKREGMSSSNRPPGPWIYPAIGNSQDPNPVRPPGT